MPWYALQHDGQYLRLRWQLFDQKSLPVTSIEIQQAALQYDLINARAEARRAAAQLGLRFDPVEVRIVGHGRNEKITLARPPAGGGER